MSMIVYLCFFIVRGGFSQHYTDILLLYSAAVCTIRRASAQCLCAYSLQQEVTLWSVHINTHIHLSYLPEPVSAGLTQNTSIITNLSLDTCHSVILMSFFSPPFFPGTCLAQWALQRLNRYSEWMTSLHLLLSQSQYWNSVPTLVRDSRRCWAGWSQSQSSELWSSAELTGPLIMASSLLATDVCILCTQDCSHIMLKGV